MSIILGHHFVYSFSHMTGLVAHSFDVRALHVTTGGKRGRRKEEESVLRLGPGVETRLADATE